MTLFTTLETGLRNTLRQCVKILNEYLNSFFKNKEFNKLLKIYNLLNSFRTYRYKIAEIIFSCNKDSYKYLHASLYTVSTVKDFCKMKNYKYLIVEEEQFRGICVPHYCNTLEEEEIIKAISPEIYIAEIHRANIIGENSVIITENFCLYDIAKEDKEKRYNLRFGSVKNIDEDYTIVQSIRSKDKIEQAISLIGFASFNYYHFTIELVSRLQYIDSFKEYLSIPIMIDEKVLNIPQYKELLDMMNVTNHPIIPIKKNHIYEVEKLIYPSYNSWLPINLKKGEALKPEDFLMAKSAIEYIRNIILKNDKIDIKGGNRRIFISRKNASNTRLVNEKAVIEIIKRYNFEIVYPEELSFLQQVNLFSQAEYIAGATGAAFTNIIFCPTYAKVMCIIPRRYKYYGYSTIAKMFNLKCVFIDAEVITNKQAISAELYKMNLVYFNQCLEKIILN